MTKLERYEEYFESIARLYSLIGHTNDSQRFFKMTYAQVIAGERRTANMREFCFLLMEFEPTVKATNTRQYRAEVKATFEILRQPDNRDDMSDTQIMGTAHEMCEEVYAYLMVQHKERTFPLGFLSEDDVDFYPVQSKFDKKIGYGCSFKYHEGFAPSKIIKPTNWND